MARSAGPGRQERDTCAPPSPGSLGFLISQVGRSVGRSFHEALAPLDLEPRQYLLLASVAARHGCSQQAIGGSLQIPPSRMVVLVDDLERRGLIKRIPNPADRRAHALQLTPAGRRLLNRARPIAEAHEADLCEPLDEHARATLVELLGRIAAHRRLTLGHPRGELP